MGPGLGNAFELEAAGGGGWLEADPDGADAPADAGDNAADGPAPDCCADAWVDDPPPALGCDALTEAVTDALGRPECEAVHAVLTSATALSTQLIAATGGTRKVLIGTDPGTAALDPSIAHLGR